MTDGTERAARPVSATEAPHTGTPMTAPGSDRDTAAGATGVTLPGDGGSREPAHGGPDDLSVPPAPHRAPAVPRAGRNGRHETVGADRPLVSRDDQDKLALRMQQAVTDFVESPRRAVEKADSTFDEIVTGLTEALAERGRVLRASWQEQDTEARTEELRVALQRYRDISEQLLRI